MFVARSTGFSGTIQRSSNATLELYRLGETGDILSNRPNTGYHLESGAAIGHWWGAPTGTFQHVGRGVWPEHVPWCRRCRTTKD